LPSSLDEGKYVSLYQLSKVNIVLNRQEKVGNDFFLSNSLFYRTMLGLDVEESLELFDPRGIVYSRVAKNKNGTIRIPLSSTRSRGTSSDNFIEKSGGAGIQQIALQTDDIFETASFIQDKNLVLPIPANYYDDLLAKTNLSKMTIENMQTFNILYDKHEDGSFFHFYLKELNGLFIEIVQRTGTYNRYGEVNAQVRLASQARGRQ
jgi:4-hydroxyphenylpyruvate dioxygenase